MQQTKLIKQYYQITNEDMKKLVNRRYRSLYKRSENLGVTPPKKEDFYRLMELCIQNGFKCAYCNCNLKIKDEYPYLFVPSYDHKIPLIRKKDNSIENLTICCHRCNILKGTINSKTYIKLLDYIRHDSKLMYDMFSEMFDGRLKDKLNRVDEENHRSV